MYKTKFNTAQMQIKYSINFKQIYNSRSNVSERHGNS